ncbi:hypothetical protein [Salibacterium aidingense]|uniref:hypothetical protein n=1 Tax=Salibacterium aidingense TaxID=384933 RepID=UPI003BE28E07
MTECRMCWERGKTWNGDDPRCAFPGGVFTPNNWNCATMGRLRAMAEENGHCDRDDNSCGSIGFVRMNDDYAPEDYDGLGGYVVMSWYKDRGKTGHAIVMDDHGTQELTLQHAEIALKGGGIV